MKKLEAMNPVVKIIAILILLAIPIFTLTTRVSSIGYVALFAGLFVVFEGFGMRLVWKILTALVLGFVLTSSGFYDLDAIVVIKPVGSKIFMNLLTMALVPLVFSSILTGVTSLGDVHRLNRIGLRTIVYYIATTAVAITIGLGYANLFQPGKNISSELRDKFQNTFATSASAKVTKAKSNKQSFFETMQGIVPKNIMNTVSGLKPNMLAIIFFAIMCGIALLHVEAKYFDPVNNLFVAITEVTVHLVMMAMRFAPYGVFAIIAATIAATRSSDLIIALLPFSGVVLLGLATHAIGTNFVSMNYLSKVPVIANFRKMRTVLLTAFSTASSGATMPMTLEVTEKEIGVKNDVAGFVIPLGATINMDGTALFQGVSAIFLANIYGIHLGLGAQITVIAMAVMASIGTAAVPGVGVVILTMILVSVGIPPEGILFILPVNNILDMFRTSVNVMGDMTCAVYINASEGNSLVPGETDYRA